VRVLRRAFALVAAGKLRAGTPAAETWEDTVEQDRLSMDEVDAEGAVALPSKEVLSLLDVNANVDLGLDLAAPVDLAAAANLNVAAPIEAAASANLLSPDAVAIGEAQQQGTIDQGITGSATATAPQHADVTQDGTPSSGTADATTGDTGSPAGATTGDAASSPGAGTGDTGGATTTGGVDSLLNGGSLLDANIDVHANADLAAPIDGAVAANANVAAPVDAAVGANIGSPGAVAEAVAPQEIAVSQQVDATADATATQDASVAQQ
jgi:hypothetical protein